MPESSVVVTASEFSAHGAFRSLPMGSYDVEYTDDTHVPSGKWVRLLTIELVSPLPNPNQNSPDANALYLIRSIVPTSRFSKHKEGESKRNWEDSHLRDYVAQSLVRCGILRPHIDHVDYQKICELARAKSALVVPDTNALSNGAIAWLFRSLPRTRIWLLPIVISLTQVQQRDSWLKVLHSDKSKGDVRQAIGSRILVNQALSLLERYRHSYEVLEVDPQLLRYVRPGGRGTADSDSGDVLEDRLIVEAIHGIVESTRSAVSRYVVTADVMLARILRAESIPFLLLQPPQLSAGDLIPSVRFEPLSSQFQGATLDRLLWDLAHSFGTIRLVAADGKRCIRLEAYWPHKGVHDWLSEQLTLRLDSSNSVVPAMSGGSALSPPRTSPRMKRPYVSLVPALRLVKALHSERKGSLSEIARHIPATARPTLQVLRKASALLILAGLAGGSEDRLEETDGLSRFWDAWQAGDLDIMSGQLANFVPYDLMLKHLKIRGKAKWKTVPDSASVDFGLMGRPPDRYNYDNLLRYAIYLGQAWTEGQVIHDGTNRPKRQQLVGKFREIFDRRQSSGLVQVERLVSDICLELQTSPWYVERALVAAIDAGELPEFYFATAFGGRPAGRDFVIAPAAFERETDRVPMDRLTLSTGPVLTVARKDG